MQQSLPLTRDLVLIGGGHTHALVLRRWAMSPLPGTRLTLITPEPEAAYSGMLPGFVAGHYSFADLSIDLVKLARFAGARLILAPATGIDLAARSITVPGRPAVGYDIASVDIGITTAMPLIPGFTAHATPAKPLAPFAAAWAAERARPGPHRIAIIGGGIAGVELALAMAHALLGQDARVTLIDRAQILPGYAPAARVLLLGALARAGIALIEGTEVAEVSAQAVLLADGRVIPATFALGVAGAQPHGWLADSGLTLHQGFVSVDRTLRSSDPAVFAAGDCAHLTWDPRPKAGVYAVRQAPVLLANLTAALSGGPLARYAPQKDYLKLVSLGDQRALAEKWGRAQAGHLIWRWKDRIDRRFMAMFHTLPPMPGPALPRRATFGVAEALSGGPPCAGCGAKVGRGALNAVLAGLPALARADVRALPGDDAAVLTVGGAQQVITTDHLSAVVLDPVLMARIAAIHALGDIWAMGAAPQAATISLILPRLSAPLQRRTLEEIMATLTEVLAQAGAAIAGGHTSTGDSLSIGLTLTGLLDRPPITLAGGQPGDALILTRALGSGTILAAEMRALVPGTTVAAAWAAMQQPQGQAARLLAGAHAMTDVTGFGLAGHLANLCAASGVAAEIDLAALPLMDGAEALAAAGLRSSLWATNREEAGPVIGAAGPRGALLFDPQTCGGLLAALPPDLAEAALPQLHAAGYRAAIIGRLVAGPAQIICR